MTTDEFGPTADPRSRRYISAEKQAEDDFGDKFTMQSGEIVYDAKTKMGYWATMSETSFNIHGIMIGLGLGQKYQRQANGQLLKIDG